MAILNNWAPVAVIIIGYVVGLYFQNKRLDDFKEGLYRYLDARFKAIEDRLDKIESRLDKLETPVTH